MSNFPKSVPKCPDHNHVVCAADSRGSKLFKKAPKISAEDKSLSTQKFEELYLRLASQKLLHTEGRVERFEVEASYLNDIKVTCSRLDPPLPLLQVR